jgi:hypothetical protein
MGFLNQITLKGKNFFKIREISKKKNEKTVKLKENRTDIQDYHNSGPKENLFQRFSNRDSTKNLDRPVKKF